MGRLHACFFLLSIYLAMTSPVSGQEFTPLTTADGMVSNQVTCLHQDSKGYLWIGTRQGLSRHDGKNFQNYFPGDELADDQIESIYEGSSGRLHVLCQAGSEIQDSRGGNILKRFVQGQFITIGPDLGLQVPFVTCCAEDRNGRLWVGTVDGIFQEKDGLFNRIPLPSDISDQNISAIHPDSSGNVWIGTQTSGLGRMDSSRHVQLFTLDEGLPDLYITALAESNGKLWVGTKNHAARMVGDRFIQVKVGKTLIDRIVYQVELRTDNEIWFRCGLNGLSSWSGGKLKFWGEEEGLDVRRINDLVMDQEGHIWVLGQEGCFAFRQSRFEPISDNPSTREGVKAVLRDREDILWVGSDHGLIKEMTGHFVHHATLTKPDTTAQVGTMVKRIIASDSQGNLYFPLDEGLASWDGADFKIHTEKDGLPPGKINNLFIKEDHLFIFTTDGGHCWFTDNRCYKTEKIITASPVYAKLIDDDLFFQDYFTAQGFLYRSNINGELDRIKIPLETKTPLELEPIPRFAMIEKDRKGLIHALSTAGKLYMIKKDHVFLNLKFSEEGLSIYHMFRDNKGNLWLTSNSELILFDGEKRTFPLAGSPAEKYQGSTAFFHDSRDWVWIDLGPDANVPEEQLSDPRPLFAGWRDGQVKFLPYTDKLEGRKTGELQFEDSRGQIWFCTEKELICFADEEVRTYPYKRHDIAEIEGPMFEDSRGVLWLPLQRGIAKIEGGNLEVYNIATGLGGNRVIKIVEDGKGNLWFALASGGITRYRDGTFITYTRKDGLSDNNTVALAIDRLGSLWIRTESGIDHFEQNEIPPKMGDLEVQTDERRLVNPSDMIFPRKEKNITFSFTGLNFRTSPENLSYSFYLEGLNTGWSPYTHEKSRTYSLSHGDYVFRVKTRNRELQESDEITFAFTLLPPWWRTWWFYSLTFLSLTFLGWSFYKRKVKSFELAKVDALRRQKEQLERQRIQDEIRQAQKIQLSLLPGADPVLKGFQFSSMSEPAVEVGGDYYDYIHLSESKLAIAMGDVSGHGIPSGLLMSMAKSSLYTNTEKLDQVGDIMVSLGKIIYQFSQRKMFMSFIFSILDAEKKELRFSIAGHPPLFHYRKDENKITELGKGAYPLGIDPGTAFHEEIISLCSGDVLLYYTDGIPERRNATGDVFGYDRLASILHQSASDHASNILKNILTDLKVFAGEIGADDDMTMVVVKVI